MRRFCGTMAHLDEAYTDRQFAPRLKASKLQVTLAKHSPGRHMTAPTLAEQTDVSAPDTCMMKIRLKKCADCLSRLS
jgi:hypothetical protein